MEELKDTQAFLRDAITAEVKRYCGYAEDVHNDFIIVKESNLTVDFQSYHDSEHKDGYKYYPLQHLVTLKGFCFIPDPQGIEAVVQDIAPSPEVKDFIDRAISRISQFLRTYTPSNLKQCYLSVGVVFNNFGCYDESAPDKIASFDPDSPEEEDLEDYKHYPLRRFVTKGKDSYTIKSYPLARLAVEILTL